MTKSAIDRELAEAIRAAKGEENWRAVYIDKAGVYHESDAVCKAEAIDYAWIKGIKILRIEVLGPRGWLDASVEVACEIFEAAIEREMDGWDFETCDFVDECLSDNDKWYIASEMAVDHRPCLPIVL